MSEPETGPEPSRPTSPQPPAQPDSPARVTPPADGSPGPEEPEATDQRDGGPESRAGRSAESEAPDEPEPRSGHGRRPDVDAGVVAGRVEPEPGSEPGEARASTAPGAPSEAERPEGERSESEPPEAERGQPEQPESVRSGGAGPDGGNHGASGHPNDRNDQNAGQAARADEGEVLGVRTSWGVPGRRDAPGPAAEGRPAEGEGGVAPVPSASSPLPLPVPAQAGPPPSSPPPAPSAPPPALPSAAPVPSQPAGRPQTEPTRVEQALARGLAKITGAALGPYQVAVVRIGFAFTWLCFLLREFPHRRELYGPDSPWSWDLGDRLVEGNGAFTALLWTDSTTWFELVYGLAIVASLGLVVGWRTRTMSVLFMVGVLSLQNRSVFMGDGGDNIIHLMALYLVLTRCGQVWSLDARRARRRAADPRPDSDLTGVALWSVLGVLLAALQLVGLAELSLWDRGPIPEFGWFPGIGWATVFWGLWLAHGVWWVVQRHAPGEPRAVLDVLINLVHNAALLVIMVEVCLVYSTAGWYKIQGSRWQDGTAVYYPMHLDYFAPWPSLSEALGNSGLMIMIATYGTVLVQVAFPFTLFNRKVKNVLLAVMMVEHASIAIMLGLPFFSMAMIAADAVFLPTVFLLWLGRCPGWLASRFRPGGRGARQPGQDVPGGPGGQAPGAAPHDRTLVG